MPPARNEFADYVVELMASWAPVSARRMFGGHGLYREGLMFALIAGDQLYFKTDTANVGQFERADCHPFVYESRERTVQMSYWSAPAACLESPAEMRGWCQSSYAAALRAHAAKPVKRAVKKAK
jgi:DNA transformation protein